MSFDPIKVAAAISSGLSIVCATCENYWQARDLNVPEEKCLAKDGCGSPIAGDVFHEYIGPMKQFDRFCFVCGNQSTSAIRVDNLVRVIGCCEVHVDLVKTLQPVGRMAPKLTYLTKGGEVSTDEPKPGGSSLKIKFG